MKATNRIGVGAVLVRERNDDATSAAAWRISQTMHAVYSELVMLFTTPTGSSR